MYVKKKKNACTLDHALKYVKPNCPVSKNAHFYWDLSRNIPKNNIK